jgi:hypothetical protein
MTFLEVFKFLVEKGCNRSAAALWVELFDGRLWNQGLERARQDGRLAGRKPGGHGAGHYDDLVNRFSEVPLANELREMFALVADERGAMSVRDEIMFTCGRNVALAQQHHQATGATELLMALWNDTDGTLVARSLEMAREVKQR